MASGQLIVPVGYTKIPSCYLSFYFKMGDLYFCAGCSDIFFGIRSFISC